MRGYTPEEIVVENQPIPESLQVGTKIMHHGRGPGTVVLLRSLFPPTVFVEFDAGDVHGYKAHSWHKLKPKPKSDVVTLVAMVQRGDLQARLASAPALSPCACSLPPA